MKKLLYIASIFAALLLLDSCSKGEQLRIPGDFDPFEIGCEGEENAIDVDVQTRGKDDDLLQNNDTSGGIVGSCDDSDLDEDDAINDANDDDDDEDDDDQINDANDDDDDEDDEEAENKIAVENGGSSDREK